LARAGSSPLVLECAIQQACSLEVICASIMVGEGFSFVESISLLEQTAIASAFQSPKLTHFARWLRQDMSLMASRSKSARLWMNLSAMSQPKYSEVRQDMQALLDQTAMNREAVKLAISSSLLSSSDRWIRSRTLGGRLEFDTLLATFLGHTNWVTSVCVSPDGSRIISGSYDNTVRVWDAVSGACVSTLEGHTGYVWSVCVSPDGSRIISGSDDKTVRVWDAVSGACVSTLEGHSNGVSSVCVSPDGSRIISGSNDNTVRVWDAFSSAFIDSSN
jgi:WD40 repeat protein